MIICNAGFPISGPAVAGAPRGGESMTTRDRPYSRYMTLAYEDRGSGPAVVLIHGHPFDRSLWRPQLESLSATRRIVAPDLRGFGESTVTAGTVSMRELADDVWELLAELGIEAVAVVGLSMGGLVAMEMAIAHPQRIWALGLVATTAQPVTGDERERRLALADRVEAEGMGVMQEYMSPQFGPDADPRVVAEVQAMISRNRPEGAAAALRGRAARPDYRPRLRELALPSFVCVGTHDVWSTPAVTQEIVDCLRDPHTVTLENVGHLPNLEAPESFDAELSSFLDAAWRKRS
jgi:pimeloyl-ACP methyl ester carboxylesterase